MRRKSKAHPLAPSLRKGETTMKKIFFSILLLASFFCNAQNVKPENDFIVQLMNNDTSHFLQKILANKAGYRLQIIYTQIDRDSLNQPHFTTYTLDADKYYYYCASMIKLPAVVLSLEKLNNLNSQYHVTKFDSLHFNDYWCDGLNERNMMDTSRNPCIAEYVKEIFLCSNNACFNSLYDFLGQKYFADRCHQLGFNSVCVVNRFASCDTFANRITNPYSLYDRKTGGLKYYSEPVINPLHPKYTGPLNPFVGKTVKKGYNTIYSPHSFKYSDYISLSDLHRMLTHIMFPQTQPDSQKLNLTTSDYQFLHKYMSMYPHESKYPAYDSTYKDDCVKYYLKADTNGRFPTQFRIFNKVGFSWGFMTDCSYVIDTVNKVEFILSAAIYVNANDIYDSKFEYYSTGFPFFRHMFNEVYNYELTRPREYKPIFEKINYVDDVLPSHFNN